MHGGRLGDRRKSLLHEDKSWQSAISRWNSRSKKDWNWISGVSGCFFDIFITRDDFEFRRGATIVELTEGFHSYHHFEHLDLELQSDGLELYGRPGIQQSTHRSAALFEPGHRGPFLLILIGFRDSKQLKRSDECFFQCLAGAKQLEYGHD